MNNKVLTTALAFIAGTMLVNADQIDWNNSVSGPQIVDRFGVAVPDGSSFLITMWEDGGNLAIDNYGSGDDHMVTGLSASFNLGPGSDGFFFSTFDPTTLPVSTDVDDGDRVYTRIFNAATPGTATWYVDVDSALATVADNTPPGAFPWNYDPGGTVAGDWKPIPEPATLALLGIGLAGVASRRMRKK